ncbi:MAG: VOC family protein [Methylocella sp.]
MSRGNPWQSPDVVPTLAYDDVPRAAAWLGCVFGFKERSDARLTWDDGSMTWMEIGDGLIHLSSSGGHNLHSPKIGGCASHALKVYVDDVDGHFARARAAGAKIISDPEDGFWGGRIYGATDIEGHHWEFAQKGRDLAAEEWRLLSGLTRGRLSRRKA